MVLLENLINDIPLRCDPMNIVVTAGKGGTGKTTVATNLALALSQTRPVQLLDCDVEEPDAHIFLDIPLTSEQDVFLQRPEVDQQACNRCGVCSDSCQFNAIAVVAEKTLVYPELCHGCGLCSLVCPQNAITEAGHKIGVVEWGQENNLQFFQGELTVGDPIAPPIIEDLKNKLDTSLISVLDSPPGTACPAVETMQGADFALLVTEPTPFGLHDLELAIKVCRKLGVPYGVVVNREGVGNIDLDEYCQAKDIPLILSIPDRREIAELYAEGKPFVLEKPDWIERFMSVIPKIRDLIDDHEET